VSLFHKHDPVEETHEVGTAADVEKIMRKYDRESNVRIWEGKPQLILRVLAALFSVYCIWSTLFSTMMPEEKLNIFLGLILIMGYLHYPINKNHVRPNYIPWYDIIIMIAGALPFLYFAANARDIIGLATRVTRDPIMVIMAIAGILAFMELCRRCVGIPILCVVGALLIYTFSTVRFGKVIYDLFYTTTGLMNTPISVCVKYIVVFIIFGAFLERTGISALFINMANSLVGGFAGGPAKVAVISSALCGMVSGSSVGNTVTTGSVTIPMMKKTGYKGEFAGAVEAAASTGGQIMPPIMGAAAFLMAETVGVPYSDIVVRAILPAVLYFAGVFITVHLEAKKEGLRGLSKEELPKLIPLLKRSYLLLPLLLLIYLVGSNTYSIAFAAAIAIIAAIAVSLFNKENRITPKRLFEALAAGAQGMIAVAVACGVAGIVAGTIGVTGLAYMLFNGIVALAGNQVIIALFLTMLCCIILGMGVPTTANYCIMAATCAPILVQMGVPMIAAHFFVFYFGIVADLTPPVALAAYAGAAIAQANPMKTAFVSTKLAIGAFIVPYVFALNPAMLFIGDVTVFDFVLIVITSFVGIFAVSASLEGYFLGRMPWYQRLLSLCGGLLLIYPGLVTDLIGLGLVGIMIVLQVITRNADRALKNA